MPFEKGHKKLGGLKRGTKIIRRKKIRRVEDLLTDASCEPIQEVLKILATSEQLKDKEKIAVWMDLYRYCHAPPLARPEIEELDVEGMSEEEVLKLAESIA